VYFFNVHMYCGLQSLAKHWPLEPEVLSLIPDEENICLLFYYDTFSLSVVPVVICFCFYPLRINLFIYVTLLHQSYVRRTIMQFALIQPFPV